MSQRPRPGDETVAEPAAAVEEPIEVYEVADSETDPRATLVDMPANATLVVAEAEALLVRPAPAATRPRLAPAAIRPPTSRPGHRGLALSVALSLAAGVAAKTWFGREPAPLPGARRVSPSPSPIIPETIQTVYPRSSTVAPPSPDAAATTPVATTRLADSGSETPADRTSSTTSDVPSRPAIVTSPLPPPPAAPSVPDLLAQAAQAIGAKDYETALARYAEALAADPGNAEATAGSVRAQGDRAALGRFFQTQPTIRDVPKETSTGSCGPWDTPCAKARVLDCKLEYVLTPATPVQGEPYRIEVTAVNTGQKGFKVQSLTAIVSVNGEQAPHPIASLEKDVARSERKVVGRLEGVWRAGTTSWWLEAAVKDQKGDSYRAQFTWELRTPAR
jgi:hypothetical protein